MIIDNNLLIILLSLVIIASYLFNIVSKKIKIPSVLLLIGLGMSMKALADNLHIDFIIPNSTVDLMGTFGLILIVLEASLELKLNKEEIPTIRNAFIAATIILLVSSVSMGFVIKFWLGTSLKRSLISAIPLAVTSSAIAIPSVAMLSKKVREFIIYEATFSDVIGILLFNYMIQDQVLNWTTLKFFSINIVIIIALSFLGSFFLLFLINKITGHIKSFLILAILLLLYAGGKIFHLPSLLLVLTFGLLINNVGLLPRKRVESFLDPNKLKAEIIPFKHIVEETAFLIRTCFFVFFGYNVDLKELAQPEIFFSGIIIFVISLIIRYLYLKFAVRKTERIVKLFLAPRGLITVLLFYSIPDKYIIPEFSIGIVFIVVIVSGMLMTISLWLGKKGDGALILDNENLN